MKRSVTIALTLIIVSAPLSHSQTAFEVASVKVSLSTDRASQRGLGQIQYSPDTLTMRGISLWMCLRWAYGVENFQVSGPTWMQFSPVYDVTAKAPSRTTENQMRLMLRTLLAERFRLTVHHVKKEMPVTALVAIKGGAKFHASERKYDPGLGAEAPLHFFGYDSSVHIQRSQEPNGRIRDSYTNVSMPLFTALLEGMSSRTAYDGIAVVDMTGLRGGFDFAIVPDPPQHSEGDSTVEDPLDAVRRILPSQLGLTLENRKAMVDVIIVDHVDKVPSPN